MEREFDIAIIGAGPAGLTAAITAKSLKPGAKVALVEKMERAGKKLSASGNGRGNLSNRECNSLPQVLQFFSESGIAVKADEAGRLYPYSEEAKAVSSALVKRAENEGVVLLTDTKVNDVEACRKGGFRIFVCDKDREYVIRANKVAVATGGKSFSSYGCTGDGYAIARSLGHNVVPPVPALTAIEVTKSLKKLKGVRTKALVSLFQDGRLIFKERGEVQFREDSLSGICIMNMSSHLPVADKAGNCVNSKLESCRIAINFVPDFLPEDFACFLREKSRVKGMSAGDLLETLLKRPVAEMLLDEAGVSPSLDASELSTSDLTAIGDAAEGFTLIPCGRKGWKEAQVTKGGVALDEIDLNTMESKVASGLYFAGEVIDYDGPCGGYNLHNAWLTGLKAGAAMASNSK